MDLHLNVHASQMDLLSVIVGIICIVAFKARALCYLVSSEIVTFAMGGGIVKCF